MFTLCYRFGKKYGGRKIGASSRKVKEEFDPFLRKTLSTKRFHGEAAGGFAALQQNYLYKGIKTCEEAFITRLVRHSKSFIPFIHSDVPLIWVQLIIRWHLPVNGGKKYTCDGNLRYFFAGKTG